MAELSPEELEALRIVMGTDKKEEKKKKKKTDKDY